MTVEIVGAGPAGCATALALAGSGIDAVLVTGDRKPADHDVYVAAPTAEEITRSLPRWSLSGLRFRFGTGPDDTLSEFTGFSCDRSTLEQSLLRQCEAAGVRIVHRPTGAAIHTVLATGPQAGEGTIWAQRLELPVQSWLDVTFDPPDLTGTGNLRAVVMIPSARDRCTMLVLTRGAPPTSPPRLPAGARPLGRPALGLLGTAFDPRHVVRDGALLVGSAAGLTNPFTGEGLSYAFQSGHLAAAAIQAFPDDPKLAGAAYQRGAAREFLGYFGAARHAARRYHLTWRAFAATAQSKNGFFVKGRRALLLPAGLPAVSSGLRVALSDADALRVRPFLAACDEVEVATVREKWPFVARLLASGDGPTSADVRPALLLLASSAADGGPPDTSLIPVAAAIELAVLGSLAFLRPPATDPARGVDWATTTAVLAGDFLLSAAARLVAQYAPDASWSFAQWLGDIAAHRSALISGHGSAAAMFGTLFEFAARIGASRSDSAVGPCRTAGYHAGEAFIHVEHFLGLADAPTRLGSPLSELRAAKVLPDLDSAVSGSQAQSQALQSALDAAAKARRAASQVPAATARRLLESFIDAIVDVDTNDRRRTADQEGRCP
ncbi:hypothetical protein OG474_39175 [Kribbella sp. NBC_01505]|uniref:hypothetical protein n=1 Tax=Kribbella sp. NBC_01505 TaxID=2903580 RepID=UPI003869D8D3